MLIVFVLQLCFNGCIDFFIKNFILKDIKLFLKDKNDDVLHAHRLIYGIIGILAASKNGKDAGKGFKNGVLAGEVAYFGKEIARKRRLGLIGKVIHSLGVSMLENQILNKPLFSRYKVYLPPSSLEFDIYKGLNCKLLAGSLLGILINLKGLENIVDLEKVEVLNKLDYSEYKEVIEENLKCIRLNRDKSDYDLSIIDSLLSGNPVFIFKEKPPKMSGINLMGIITLYDFKILPHEITHSLQYREAGIFNLLIEENICSGLPILFSQDLAYLLLLPLFEEEAHEYDN